MKLTILLLVAVTCLAGCSKNTADFSGHPASVQTNEFVRYVIPQGQHYASPNSYKSITTSALNFTVRFDSSAIYQTVLPSNQYDINKLAGFADNRSNHHQFSARFGWRWSDGALRLFGYVYNEGAVVSKELQTIPIGVNVACAIQVLDNRYAFVVNGAVDYLPRAGKTTLAEGYLLYPYFGGDETAPHEISIHIRYN